MWVAGRTKLKINSASATAFKTILQTKLLSSAQINALHALAAHALFWQEAH